MEVIQAAGAVLWRRLSDDLIQIALIHRPRYDDWSFPKGKVEIGESEIACAFREVL
jgi:8-oxo-dGTP diphosphatase